MRVFLMKAGEEFQTNPKFYRQCSIERTCLDFVVVFLKANVVQDVLISNVPSNFVFITTTPRTLFVVVNIFLSPMLLLLLLLFSTFKNKFIGQNKNRVILCLSFFGNVNVISQTKLLPYWIDGRPRDCSWKIWLACFMVPSDFHAPHPLHPLPVFYVHIIWFSCYKHPQPFISISWIFPLLRIYSPRGDNKMHVICFL